MLTINNKKPTPADTATPPAQNAAQQGATIRPGADSIVPLPQAPQAQPQYQPETSDKAYSAQLSTWLQNFDPNQESQPLVTEEQTPAEQVGMSEKASVWQPGTDTYDWMKAVYGDHEEDAARERRNRTILGITALGDAVRHFGNIYHTTKGAPAQTLTNATKEESDRQIKDTMLLQQQRQKANEMLLKYQKMEADRLYRQQDAERKNYELALKEENLRQQAAYRQKQGEQIDARMDDMQKRRELAAKQFDHKVQMDKQNFQQKQREFAERVRHNRASEANQAAMRSIQKQKLQLAARKGGGSVGSSGGTNTYLTGGHQLITVPKGKLNSTNVRHIFNKVLDNASPEERINLRRMKTDAERIDAIMQNTDIPGVAEDLKNLGAEGLTDLTSENAPEGVSKSFWQTLRDAVNSVDDEFYDFLDEHDFMADDSLWE